jgi:hypothetical protein
MAENVDLRPALITADDLGLKEQLGRVVSKTVQMNMFSTEYNANWIGDRIVRRESFPLMRGTIPFQYSSFKLELGDLFKVNFPLYGITSMICRVMGKSLGDIENDKIVVDFQQDPDYVTQESVLPLSVRSPAALDFSIADLTDITLVEAPYVLVGEQLYLVPLVGRKKGTELGFKVYMSLDGGSSYFFMQYAEYYAVRGVLVYDFEDAVTTLDKGADGITIDFDIDADVGVLQTITRTEMLAGANIAMITDGNDSYGELLSFETITPDPVVTGRYKLTNLFRGRLDTKTPGWLAGDDFYFIGSKYNLISHPQFIAGLSRHFKLVPYNSKTSADITDALETEYTFFGRAFSPYFVGNLKADGVSIRPLYIGGDDIDLSWSPRIRGEGAGLGNADGVTDAPVTWEGLFEVKVYVSDVLVRTETDINDDEWAYTNAMNISDNGSPPGAVRFDVLNFIETGGQRYDSPVVSSLVTKVITTTTTTTTTT